MNINVRKPIFFSSSIHFCRKFCWITLYTAVISCLTVLKREFFPIFSTFMIVLIHIFQICNEYAMIFSPETEFSLEFLIFSPPNLFHWKFICVGKVNMHVDSNFFNCAWIFLVKHGSKLQNSYIFFKIENMVSVFNDFW